MRLGYRGSACHSLRAGCREATATGLSVVRSGMCGRLHCARHVSPSAVSLCSVDVLHCRRLWVCGSHTVHCRRLWVCVGLWVRRLWVCGSHTVSGLTVSHCALYWSVSGLVSQSHTVHCLWVSHRQRSHATHTLQTFVVCG